MVPRAPKYHIIDICCDDYRQASESVFKEHGCLYPGPQAPITHAKVAPLIEQIFAEETLVFGTTL